MFCQVRRVAVGKELGLQQLEKLFGQAAAEAGVQGGSAMPRDAQELAADNEAVRTAAAYAGAVATGGYLGEKDLAAMLRNLPVGCRNMRDMQKIIEPFYRARGKGLPPYKVPFFSQHVLSLILEALGNMSVVLLGDGPPYW